MREFFRGWRRKLGVLTLLMACVFAAGWVRSYSIHDMIYGLVVLGHEREFHSILGDLMITTFQSGQVRIPFYYESYSTNNNTMEPIEYGIWPLYVQHPSEIFRSTRHFGGQFISIRYWSIVLPLTVLSAFLLLTKPRKSNQKKTLEPIPEKLT